MTEHCLKDNWKKFQSTLSSIYLL